MSKKGAMEMSVGTIVVVVLAMSMLILGMVLLKGIFSGSTDAVTNINKGVINEINNLFTKPDTRIALYPTTATITLKQGQKDGGFAFSIKNNDVKEQTFTYSAEVVPGFQIEEKCNIGANDANAWIILGTGSATIPPGRSMSSPELILFTVPEIAPPCTIPFQFTVKNGDATYDQRNVYVTIEGK